MLQNSTTCTFIFHILYSSSTRYIYIQHYTFVFNNTHFLSTSTKSIFMQEKYSFNLNQNYFCSTEIFVQLQPELFLFNCNNNYSTSTMHCKLITYLFYDNGFESSWTFRISSLTNYLSDSQTNTLYYRSSPPITKMASEDRTGSDVEHIYIQVVEFCNIWLTINVGLGNFLRLDAGYKYNGETGIRSFYEIRNKTATCGCVSEAQNLKIHEGRISLLLQ